MQPYWRFAYFATPGNFHKIKANKINKLGSFHTENIILSFGLLCKAVLQS